MPAPPAQTVQSALQELREQEGLTLPALARLLGFGESTTNSWYYCRRSPRAAQIATIRDRTAETSRPIQFQDFHPRKG